MPSVEGDAAEAMMAQEKSYFRWGTTLRGGTSGRLLEADILSPLVLFVVRGLSGPE